MSRLVPPCAFSKICCLPQNNRLHWAWSEPLKLIPSAPCCIHKLISQVVNYNNEKLMNTKSSNKQMNAFRAVKIRWARGNSRSVSLVLEFSDSGLINLYGKQYTMGGFRFTLCAGVKATLLGREMSLLYFRRHFGWYAVDNFHTTNSRYGIPLYRSLQSWRQEMWDMEHEEGTWNQVKWLKLWWI